MRTRPVQFLLALALLLPGSLPAQDAWATAVEAGQWLARMQRALGELTYRGEFSYFRDGELTSLSIRHARLDGVLNERLVHLDGPRREILRRGEQVSCLLEPDDPMLDYVRRIPMGPFARAFIPGEQASGDMLPAHYSARLVGRGRIAGQAAVRVDIVPDDAARYGYRLWLQSPSAMPLRAELVDERARALEIFQFVHIEIGVSLDAADFAADATGLVRHDLAIDPAPAATADPSQWEASWLPGGFEMAAAALRRTAARDAPVQTLSYSDGLASLSVFVEPAWDDSSWTRSRRQGATTAVMREIELDDGARYLVTVVGEVPLDTAERVAAAVRPRS
jgi:sigma-E factor negative regulatory protein RseB